MQSLGHGVSSQLFNRTNSLHALRRDFQEGLTVKAAGRLITIRNMGKSVFADINDGSGRFQLYINKKALDDNSFAAFNLLASGDIIGVEGALFVTRAGEQTIKVSNWVLLSKAFLPLPEKWHGLRDMETRYRQRYLDLIANPEVKQLFEKRSEVIRSIRDFLGQQGFTEVETPMMQSVPGGAAARPFETHYAALNSKMYLRIAPELYLKRLLVGGFDKIFELNRNFRNEGLSKNHNPEFTMLEIYQAYSDMRGMMALVKNLITQTAQNVFGSLVLGEGESRVDLESAWREVPYKELIIEKMGGNWYELPLAEQKSAAEKMGLAVDPEWDSIAVTHEIYEKTIEKTLKAPTFVTRFPAPLVPLARKCEDDKTLVDVYELVINGMEISPGYSELADSLDQRERFMAQSGSEIQKVDEDFLTALEYGMPPAGGMGLGVDRLVMVLTCSESIRDVILFPQMRRKSEDTRCL